MVEQGRIENVFRLQIMNVTEVPQRYSVSVRGLDGIVIASEHEFDVLPAEVRSAVVRVQIPPGASSGSYPIDFDIQAIGQDDVRVREPAAFLVPR
jgi:polyferredoxin